MRDDFLSSRFAEAEKRQRRWMGIFWVFFSIIACAALASAAAFVWVASHFLAKFW